jgi:hypothetical protein
MVNKNYARGRKKEYRICNLKRAAGYDIVTRSAGSHSPIDIFSIDLKRKEIVFTQSKPDSMKQLERIELEHKWKSLNGNFKCRFEVI